MKFSESWLRTVVNPPLSSAALADLLTFGGIEIEAVEPVAPAFENVVVGQVLSVEKHPDADRLKVCQVNVGTATLTIVCGAPNVQEGLRVPVALVGAKLPAIEIKQAKVRGVESCGMLCSAKELGLSEESAGLLLLPDDALCGANVRDVLGLDDKLFDSKPTPNRGDCLSIRGLAREVAALAGQEARHITLNTVPATNAENPSVKLPAPQACPKYCARFVRGINAGAVTPEWMVRRLVRSGVRSINAVVDVTNYVMLELGQPLHAFDAAKVSGGIEVRFATQGERLALLNGQTRELSPDFLVIADDQKALALAGIMGGADSAVDDNTTDILLESAFFTPDVIAGKSRILGFGSDSSYRFERGVDFSVTEDALERATQLVIDICGGSSGPVTMEQATLPRREPIALSLARVQRLLGVAIDRDEAVEVFRRLGFVCVVNGEKLVVTPPAYRFDVAIEEDLVEELARVHGYHRIPAAAPVVSATGLPVTERKRSLSSLRHALAARDYQETITYSFVEPQWELDFCGNTSPIALANPIAAQMAVMRSSLVGGLINSVAFNMRRKQNRVRLFEVGRCFVSGENEYSQPWRIGAAASGMAAPEQWGIRPPRPVDFYDVKSDVLALLAGHEAVFKTTEHPALHPGKGARILLSGHDVGWIGELHPRWQQKYDLPYPVVLFELDFAVLAKCDLPVYRQISKFPPVWRDLAVVLDENISFQSVSDAINSRKPPFVAEFIVFDIYRGPGIEKGKKSLAFRMLLQDTHKTLTDAEVDSAVAETLKILEKQFKAKLR